jgi:hypothetical protein
VTTQRGLSAKVTGALLRADLKCRILLFCVGSAKTYRSPSLKNSARRQSDGLHPFDEVHSRVVNKRADSRLGPPALVCLSNRRLQLWFHRPVVDADVVDQAEEETTRFKIITFTLFVLLPDPGAYSPVPSIP